jgi:hypothetical protein
MQIFPVLSNNKTKAIYPPFSHQPKTGSLIKALIQLMDQIASTYLC